LILSADWTKALDKLDEKPQKLLRTPEILIIARLHFFFCLLLVVSEIGR